MSIDPSEFHGSERVNIENDVHEIYKTITQQSGKDIEDRPFLLMKDVFMWAVALGFQAGRKRPLAPGRQQPFRWGQLQELDVSSLQAIAVADTGDVEALTRKDQVLRIAEEYANEGIRILMAEISERPGRLLWNLVDTLKTA
jgi:dnd system-associated protein 4